MVEEWLKQSSYTVVFTGAGMSTESGLPDFRSKKAGMWNKEDPSKIASTDALNRNVEKFFDFYRTRVLGLRECKPNRGHEILANWEQEGIVKAIITQNVDGFHTEAGSQNVMELHGTLQNVHCQECGTVYSSEVYEEEKFYCDCGGKLRPSVTLFGEMLPEEAFVKAAMAANQADLFFVLGSSLTVSPANQFPLMAKQNGARLVIVNAEPTPYDSYADLVINDEKIGAFLEKVNKEIENMS